MTIAQNHTDIQHLAGCKCVITKVLGYETQLLHRYVCFAAYSA